MASLSALFTLVCVGSANRLMLGFSEIFLFLALLAMFWKRSSGNPSLKQPAPAQSTSRLLAIVFYATFALAISLVILRSVENPHGEPDAWTFWKAR